MKKQYFFNYIKFQHGSLPTYFSIKKKHNKMISYMCQCTQVIKYTSTCTNTLKILPQNRAFIHLHYRGTICWLFFSYASRLKINKAVHNEDIYTTNQLYTRLYK